MKRWMMRGTRFPKHLIAQVVGISKTALSERDNSDSDESRVVARVRHSNSRHASLKATDIAANCSGSKVAWLVK